MDVIVGTAGHIDHGKTALIRALTGVDTDRLPEEKQRGITIDLGFAELAIGDTHFGFVDVPGHERFVKNMLAGAHGIDHILLVVAATDGVMPQTREHFDICRLLNIQSGTIALTKCDLADHDTIESAKLEIQDLVDGSFLTGARVVQTSAADGRGIAELKRHLSAIATESFRRRANSAARLPIDRSFTVKGFGTVVTGTLTAGELAVGDEVELLPSGRRVRIRGIQSHGRSADKARAGQRSAVNLAGISHNEIDRGMTLVESKVFRTTRALDAKIEMLADAARPLKGRERVRLHIGTSEIMARVTVLNDNGEIAPGDSGFVQIRPESEELAAMGDRLIVRTYSPQVTIGGGIVLDPFASRHRRKDFDRVTEFLESISKTIDDVARAATRFIEFSGKRGQDLDGLAARLGCSKKRLMSQLTAEPVSLLDGRYYSAGLASTLKTVEAVSVIELMPYEQEFKESLIAIYERAGKNVPRITEAVTDARNSVKISDQRLADLLLQCANEGEIVRVSDDLWFSSTIVDSIAEAVRRWAAETPDRTIDVPQFKELVGVSRKYAIPLLEYLDRANVTRRYGDKRIVLL